MGMYGGIDANGLVQLAQQRYGINLQRPRTAPTRAPQAPTQAMLAQPQAQPSIQGMPSMPVQGGQFQMLAEQLARGQSPTMFNPLMPQHVNPWLLGFPG